MYQDNALIETRKALKASWLGLGAQAVFSLAVFLLFFISKVPVLLALALFSLTGIVIWIWTALLHQFQNAVAVENFELEQTRRGGAAAESLFEDPTLARPAARRLERAYKWGMPLGGLLTGIYMLVFGLWLFRTIGTWSGLEVTAPARDSAFVMGLVFLGFAVSQYLLGMSLNKAWRLLQAGGAFLSGCVLLLFVVGVGLGAAHFGLPKGLHILRFVVAATAVLVGLEVLFNLILDLYRPRRPGEVPRPAFDSRLLTLVANPRGIVRTLNEAINYQFGFEITRSWFWRLLARTSGWLVIFGFGVLLLLSCIIIVEPEEQVLVTRFGRLIEEPLGPGLHTKWPWPISRVQRYDVDRIMQFEVTSHHGHSLEGEPLLWGTSHSGHEGEEEFFLVAAAKDLRVVSGISDQGGEGQGLSVALIGTEIYIHYRISDVLTYVMSAADPVGEFKALAEREVIRYLLRLDIDETISGARNRIGSELQAYLQATMKQRDLGLEVVWVGLSMVHPAQPVVDAFYETVGAEQERETAIQRAMQDEVRILAEAAGTRAGADQILEQIAKLESLKASGASEEEHLLQEARLEELIQQAGGKASELIAAARAYRWTVENLEHGRALRFASELEAYLAVPDFYKSRRYLEQLGDGMQTARKWIISADRKDMVLKGDLKDTQSALDGLNLGR